MSKFNLFMFAYLLVGLSHTTALGQRTFEAKSAVSTTLSTNGTLPMWAYADKYGVVPMSNNVLLEASVFSDFNKKHKIQFAYGFSAAGFIARGDNNLLIDELYASAKWKFIRVDAGMIRPDIEYNGVSSTNGNLVYSTNSRNMPGINIRTDYFSFPFIDRFIEFKANLAEYRMIDERYIEDTRLHHKSLFVKLKPYRRLELIVGIDHYGMWGGDSPTTGKQPSSLKDYIRIFFGSEGDANSSLSSQLNVLGNHLGREHFKINYLGDEFTLSAYHDIPFEDRSGIKFRTVPDGLYGLYFGKRDKSAWISDVIYEFYYTKYQAGPYHDRPATPEEMEGQDPNSHWYGKVIIGGNDNYYNHGEYLSGWTSYERTISSPFFNPIKVNADHSITLNNRLVAHYIGLKGTAWKKIPYSARFSYSMNYGTYGMPLTDKPKQFSFGLEAGLHHIKKLPFKMDLGVYGDIGKLYENSIGFSLKLSRKDIIRVR